MRIFSFEKLIAWQKGRELALLIYKTTKKVSQRRDIWFIKSNETLFHFHRFKFSGRIWMKSFKDKARFSEIAYSSSLELLNQVILSNDFEYINENDYLSIREKIAEVNMLIDGLYKSQIKKIE